MARILNFGLRSICQNGVACLFVVLLGFVFFGCRPDDGDLTSPVTTLSRRIEAVENPSGDGRILKIVDGEPHAVYAVSSIPEPDGLGSRSLAYWWLWADPQIVDEENPTRLGFFDSKVMFSGMFDAAFRPQEDISPHLLNASIMTANRIMKDFGRDFDLALGLGDNADNASAVEIDWLVDILDGTAAGAMVRPDTGDLDLVGGVNRGARNFGSQEVFNPFDRGEMPNSNADFYAPGLKTPLGEAVPWLSVVGNHDALHTGNFPVDGSPIEDPLFNNFFFDSADFVGDIAPFGYLLGLPDLVLDTMDFKGLPIEFYNMIGGPFVGGLIANPFFVSLLTVFGSDGIDAIEGEIDPNFDFSQLIPGPFDPQTDLIGARIVSDPTRAFAGTTGYIAALREQGHGFNLDDSPCTAVFSEGVDPDKGYFAVDAPSAKGEGPPVRLIFLNTAENPSVANGGITSIQWAWLECQLQRAVDDNVLVVVVSHHPSKDLTRVTSLERGGPAICRNATACRAALIELLQSVPNVIAHLVGHGHDNNIIYHEAETAANSYWEIETCSIIDWPQQTRILEIVAYRNGVGEIWSTMVDHALVSGEEDHNILTGHGRLLAANDASQDSQGHLGGENSPDDRNRILRFIIPPGVMDRIPAGDGEITSRDVLPFVD